MLVLGAFLSCAWSAASPAASTILVRNLQGQWIRPLQHLSSKATVFFFIATDCPLSNGYAPEINRIYRSYGKKGIEFESVYEDSQLTVRAADNHAKQFRYEFGGIIDAHHDFAASLSAKVTPEIVVLNAEGKTLYRGRIDNTFESVTQRREVTTQRDLTNALDQICRGESVTVPETPAIGCAIPGKD